jgi:hypothetical protein
MKKLLKLFLILFIPIISNGQDFQLKFKKCIEIKDTSCQREILTNWEKIKPEDPELYTSYFNFHFLKARQEIVTLSKNEPSGEGFELRDSTNKIAGFMGSEIYYAPNEIKNGIDKINIGIKKYPNRLDMRFGKIYVFGEIEN